MGGTAYLTGSFAGDPESNKIHEIVCEVLSDWGLDVEEDVVVILDKDWAEKIDEEINSKLKQNNMSKQ